MVARVLRLRVALLLSRFRGGALRALGFTGLLVLGAAGATGLALLPTLIARGDVALRDSYDTVITALAAILAVAVAFFSSRHHIDVRSFAPYPYTPTQIGVAVWLTGWATWPMLGVLTWLAVRVALRPEWWQAPWAVILGTAVTFVAFWSSTRVASGLSRRYFAGGAGATARRIGAVLVLAAATPLLAFAVTKVLSGDDGGLRDAKQVLKWLPEAAGTAAATSASHGDAVGAGVALCAGIGVIGVLVGVWLTVASAAVMSIPKPEQARLEKSGLGWFEYLGDTPRTAIAARTLTYWRRDPRYRVGLWALPLAPLLMIAALAIAGVRPDVIAVLPLPVMLFLLGWSIHNDVAMDSTAIWLHVTSGTRGRDDRIGRLAPVALIGVPLLFVGSSVTTTVIGDWRIFPAVLGLNAAVLMISSAVSSVASARWPYPSTRPGESPFQQPQWAGAGAGLAQTLSVLLGVVLAVPALLTTLHALANPDSFLAVLVAAVVGVGSGAVLLWAAIIVGGYVFERSGPEIVAVTEVYD